MLVFWKARLVLLAVPKTGSTALEAAFGPHADVVLRHPQRLKHMNLARYQTHFQKLLCGNEDRRMDVVAVAREPVDWLSSWYRYRRRDALSGSDRSTRDMSFEAFVEAWLQDTPPAFARVGRQSRFLTPAPGRDTAERLFRYDRLDDLVEFLQTRLELSVAPLRRNSSPEDRSLTLSPHTAARLRAEAPEEFALWDGLVADRPG